MDNEENKICTPHHGIGEKQLIVIGGGAAGFFCAINAARMNPALKVTLVEKTSKLLSKVKVSGGERCNVTHSCFEIEALVKKYPRGQNFLKKTFHWFNTQHTIDWFAERGVKLKTESDGRMFPITDSSQTIIDCLLKEANKYGVKILTSCDVTGIVKTDSAFILTTINHQLPITNYLCIASGGYAKSLQFQWLQKTGHSIEQPVPSLFTFNMPGNAITKLMGVAVENAIVKIIGTKLQSDGPILITHWGMSGPAILKLSAIAARELANKNYEFSIVINWLKDYTEQSLREEWLQLRQRYSAQKVSSKNPFGLPARLWQYLLHDSFIHEDTRWAELTTKQQNQLIKNLTAQEFAVKGKTTFKEEFVTCGGIRLSEIDANTMQSKIVPNLFFAGEVMDVDGVTGGFNFQNAWTSGWIAAKAIATS